MSTSTWIKITQTCLLGAAICMCFALWQKMPTKFDRPMMTVDDVIKADKSLEIREKSFHNVMRAMGQE